MQTLRFLAHYHGASLLVTSCKDSAGGNKDAFRACMNSLCFGVSMRPVCEVGSERPSVVTAGRDDFAAILRGKGTGKGEEEDGKSQFASNDAGEWVCMYVCVCVYMDGCICMSVCLHAGGCLSLGGDCPMGLGWNRTLSDSLQSPGLAL